jgi:hypothetical protein
MPVEAGGGWEGNSPWHGSAETTELRAILSFTADGFQKKHPFSQRGMNPEIGMPVPN